MFARDLKLSKESMLDILSRYPRSDIVHYLCMYIREMGVKCTEKAFEGTADEKLYDIYVANRMLPTEFVEQHASKASPR